MQTISDSEFGEVIIKPHHNASRISLSIAPDGRLRVTTPKRTSLVSVKLLIKSRRADIRKLLSSHRDVRIYDRAQSIGKSHTLVVQKGVSTKVESVGTKIIIHTSQNQNIADHELQSRIRQEIIKALRKEAKSYLPRRLKHMAESHDFTYSSVRLTHTSSRWGSCSSRGTISFNIALMQLPFELIDYVIAHELSHTRQMNHSKSFWHEVSKIDPEYKVHKKDIKQYTPNL